MPGGEFEIASQAQNELLGKAQSVVGLINYIKTSKIAKELAKSRPKFKSSGLEDQDLSLAESELAGGMSARAENAYTQQNDKQFASSLESLLRGGGSVNNVAEVFGNSQEGKLRLVQMQDQLRLKQIDNLVRARRYKDEQLDKGFMINEYAPWKDKQMANSAAREQAASAVWSGLQTSASAGSSAMSNAGQKEDFNDYFSGGNNKSTGADTMGGSGDNSTSYNWYQPERGNQPRVPTNRQSNNSNDYDYEFLNDPSWWELEMKGGG